MNRRHSLPAEVYALVERTPATVLLECSKPGASNQSWTQLFIAPRRICVANTPAELGDLFAEIEKAVASGWVAAGFFTYECGAGFEPKAGLRASRPGQPLAWFGIYEKSHRFDHPSGGFDSELPRLNNSDQGSSEEPEREIDAQFTISESEYAQRIAAIHEWIRAGDVYQLNFTAPFRVAASGSSAALYARLRARQPVEYGAFLHWQTGRRILSFSPELFFCIDNENGTRRITAKPMKGTASRGRTAGEDRRQTEWLRSDPKNRAENLMIVDLLRNDLGRLANFGTVRTEDLFAVERYPTLLQMTSTVTAELRPDAGYYDVFRALFPCGSITGAPKVRAMQLLAELEGQPRGVYTGAIGYFSRQRTVFNVAIRTLELEGNQGAMGVGSGIVIDSDPAAEYRECLLKAAFLTRAIHPSPKFAASPEEFSLIETMLWDACFPLLDMHLDRLADSAEYFGFPCDRTSVKAALEAYADTFADRAQRKVRLLFNSDGELQITDELAPQPEDGEGIGRVRIAAERTDPDDIWLYHKTTNRAVYAKGYKEATQAGFDDVLFLNRRGEVTEGSISNIFIEKDGRLLTPPVDRGLLPGIYRRHLLATRADAEERILSLDDLRSADAIYLSNAVRGLRRVEIDWKG